MKYAAVLGYGTVGSGVVEVIETNAELIAKNTGDEVKVKYIVDIRDFSADPHADLFVKDFAVVEADPEVNVVVETIGGLRPAYDFTKRALLAGKSVVTSNKELVATHGAELLKIARERGVNYFFEASVGGGIPIIRPMCQCLAANRIDEVFGILNGTTNYILNRMIEDGLTFEAALSEAQEKGYAERNPAADVEGYDACRKICILSALAFGRHVYPESVETDGITKITLEDVAYAESGDMVIKLLGRAKRADDGKIFAFVGPHLVPKAELIANVNGVFNSVMVRGNAVGDTMFYGRGAGKLPTASAVVADVIDACQHTDKTKYFGWEDSDASVVEDSKKFVSAYYLRVSGESVSSAVTEAFGEVKFLSREGAKANEAAFITGTMSGYKLEEKLAVLSKSCTVSAPMKVLALD
ncbi:MAG: homoserine dehydrogenase [Oscillospiraceae bacterium]|nr:homoserine dehydrogenase [Oscillospiraceae bacterium]